tara:strand:- start:403 stop:1005 length:603 start_codon:yes stop_codon:yes gene_type:complete
MKNLILLFISLFIFSCDSDSNPVGLQCESFGLIEQDGLCVDDCGVVNGDNSTCTDNQTEIDVDWLLVRTPNYEEGGNPLVSYFFYFTTNSNINNINLEEGTISCSQEGFLFTSVPIIFLSNDEGILSFNYNNEDFSFDVSNSEYLHECEEVMYSIQGEIDEPLQRIIYNKEMGYFTLFGPNGFYGTDLSSSSPNELIDYR